MIIGRIYSDERAPSSDFQQDLSMERDKSGRARLTVKRLNDRSIVASFVLPEDTCFSLTTSVLPFFTRYFLTLYRIPQHKSATMMLHQELAVVIPAMTSLENPACVENVPTGRKPRKSVKFFDLVDIRTIENTKQAYSPRELSEMFYTRQDVQRWRRLCKALAEDLSFYSDDDLWDRFAVRSKAQQRIRQQVRYALRCAVESLKDNQSFLHELSESESASDDDSFRSESTHDSTLEEYYRISQACSQVAVERALRNELEVMGQ